ncbi:MAG: nucleotide exchange factor GrpE [Acidobacteria bacterium]|nr:nucleotide exchange factor GrpE [Acidobacteriota bacterium]
MTDDNGCVEAHSPAEQFSPPERERLLQAFATWLDRVLEAESPPSGLTADLVSALNNGDPLPRLDGKYDLHSLWAAMISLTQEVRLQGRTFKQLSDTLSRSLEQAAAEAKNRDAASEQAPRDTHPPREIDILLDLRDRVERGRATARKSGDELGPERLPRLRRWLGAGRDYARRTQEIFSALVKGYDLTLDRLDDALVDLNVSVINCEGQRFDPQTMTAVETLKTTAVEAGTVLEVYRNGYEWEGKVYRPAQVKVALSPERNVEL